MAEAFRVVVALIVAAAVAAAVFVVYLTVDGVYSGGAAGVAESLGGATAFGLVAFVVALAHATVLGLPAFIVLRWAGWTQWWTSLVCGFAIGGLPYAIVSWPLREQAASFSQVDDKILVENGITTQAGWIVYSEFVAGLGLLGMISGFAAWLSWRWLRRAMMKPANMAN